MNILKRKPIKRGKNLKEIGTKMFLVAKRIKEGKRGHEDFCSVVSVHSVCFINNEANGRLVSSLKILIVIV